MCQDGTGVRIASHPLWFQPKSVEDNQFTITSTNSDYQESWFRMKAYGTTRMELDDHPTPKHKFCTGSRIPIGMTSMSSFASRKHQNDKRLWASVRWNLKTLRTISQMIMGFEADPFYCGNVAAWWIWPPACSGKIGDCFLYKIVMIKAFLRIF